MGQILISAIDKILDHFEHLIDVESSERKYAQTLLAAIMQLTKCQMLWRLQSIDQTEWMSLLRIRNSSLAEGKDFSILSDRQLGLELSERIPRAVNGSLVWSEGATQWVVVAMSDKDWSDGVLVAQIEHPQPATPQTATPQAKTPQATADVSQILPILRATAELLHAHSKRWQSDRTSIQGQRLQGFAKNLSMVNSTREAYFTVVNDLRVLLQANQVALCQKKWLGKGKVIAVSDSENSNAAAKVSKEITRIGSQAVCMRTTQFDESSSGDAVNNTSWLVAVPLRLNVRDKRVAYSIAIRWDDPDRYSEGVTTLRANWAAINNLISHSLAVQALPALLRRTFSSQQAMIGFGLRFLFATIMIGVAAWLACYPIHFTIEGQAVLEPISHGYVFASNDGVVDEIKVHSGEYVRQRQSVITIRSTEISLRLEELQGEILALQEKRNGYRLTLNQLGNDEKDIAQRSQLSADIAELDIREDSLQKTIQLFEFENSKLSLVSPIDGEVVTENIRETLEYRPVRRGEALLHIADTKGEWHFKVEVPDFELGHLLEALESNSQLQVRIRLASAPEKEIEGRVKRIADSHYANKVDSPKWEVYVVCTPDQIPSPRFGSTANVRFECGQRQAWYVWIRPVWEGLRRRFWL